MAEKEGKSNIEIPKEGSLGILALGAVGIKAWRKKRLEMPKTNQPQPSDEQ